MINLPNHCQIAWCDQDRRPHQRHECTLGSWVGEGWSSNRRHAMTVQAIVHGLDDADARLMIAIVDGKMNQVDVVLTFEQAHQLATALLTEARAFRRMQHPA